MDPDLSLLTALKEGDESALTELMNRHREPLYRFLYRFLHDETAAREVALEAFLRLFFKAKKFTPQSSVKTWLYTIAANLSRDRMRTVARRREVPIESLDEDGSAADKIDPTGTPLELAAEVDRYLVLQQAIDSLPGKLKAALVLFSLEGHSQRDVADILGTTPKTIELRIRHAKEKLRAVLRGIRAFED